MQDVAPDENERSSIIIKDGSNAMRLVKGVWKKRQPQLGIKPQTSHFPTATEALQYHLHSIRECGQGCHSDVTVAHSPGK